MIQFRKRVNILNKFETQTQELYKKEFGDYIYAVRLIPIKVLFSQELKSFVKKYFR